MATSIRKQSVMNTFASVAAAVLIGLGVSASAHADSEQALWVANGANVVEFGSQSKGAHDSKPALQLNSTVFGAPQGVVFDAQGNLWVIDGGTTSAGGTVAPSLEEFTSHQLKNVKKNQMLTPAVQITSPDFVFIQQAVFDNAGNIWVTDNGAGTVDIFAADQITTTDSVAPMFTISSSPAFNGPLGIVLHNGKLYVANNADTTIFVFNQPKIDALLPGPVSLKPIAILSDDGNGSIQGPWALIFDKAGDLWSSNANSPNTLVEFTPGEIAATGAPTPAITISPVNVGKTGLTSLSAPNGIAFDRNGNLAAVSSATPFGVAEFQPKQLLKSAATQPHAFIVRAQTTLNAPAGDNFGPYIKMK